jgi:hypothetical protein
VGEVLNSVVANTGKSRHFVEPLQGDSEIFHCLGMVLPKA